MCSADDAVLRGLGLWAVLLLLIPFLLLSSVPNLEETVPGASGNSHAIRRHPQAAHSVVVARKDSCGGKEERSGSEGGPVRGDRGGPAEDTHHRLCLQAVCGPAFSCTTCYSQYGESRSKCAEELLCVAYSHHPKGSWEGMASFHNCFHPGVMLRLR